MSRQELRYAALKGSNTPLQVYATQTTPGIYHAKIMLWYDSVPMDYTRRKTKW